MHPKPDFNFILNSFFHTIIQETKEVITRERFDSVHQPGSSSDGYGIGRVGADKGYGMIGVLVFDEKGLEEAIGNPDTVGAYRFRSVGNEYRSANNLHRIVRKRSISV